MPRFTLIEPATRASFVSLEVALPPGLSEGTFRIPRINWPEGEDVVSCDVQISFDDGVSWGPFVGFKAPGGNKFDRRGDLQPETWVKLALPQPENPRRMVRANVECVEPLSIRLDLDAE